MLARVHHLAVGACRLRVGPDVVQTPVPELPAYAHVAGRVHLVAYLVGFD